MATINVEIVLNNESQINKSSIISIAKHYLEKSNIRPNSVINHFDSNLHPVLGSEVKAIIVGNVRELVSQFIDFGALSVKWYVYTLDATGPVNHIEENEDESQINIATHLTLPSAHIYNLWENLYYDKNIKENLLKYAQTMMKFSDCGVDTNVINCNRVILLHGPPGTGKTSLCKALAQKLAIQMQDRYSVGLLVEINSHSLFSKWFSESGKLVTKMFTKITEMVENPNLLVCVLIDEVESLAHARNQCLSGNEPSDSLRVVNAVLTQLDQIKRYPNVLILTTSNITESIDLAFVDRADIKQFLGLPPPPAIYKIYQSCLDELIKAQIIKTENDIAFIHSDNPEDKYTKRLTRLCEQSVGLSGRSLRKIAFLAHALFLDEDFVDLGRFLDAMSQAIDHEKNQRSYFTNTLKQQHV